MIVDPGGVERVQVRAMEVLIKAIKVCYGLVADVEVDMLEREVEELKRAEEELAGAGGASGYRVEEASG